MTLNVLLLVAAGVLVVYALRELAPAYWARAAGALERAVLTPGRHPETMQSQAPLGSRATIAGTDRAAHGIPAVATQRPAARRADRMAAWLRAHRLALAASTSIVALALVLRTIDLTQAPPGFFADEASNALDAYGIAHTLRDQHGVLLPAFFEALNDWRGGFQIYWDVPFVALFGLSETAVRLASAVAGTLTVVLTYVFVARAINRPVGWISAFLLATSPWHLMHSRAGWEEVSVPLVTALCLTFLFVGLERPLFLPLAFVSAALGMYTYQPGRIFFPLFTLSWVVIYRRDLWRWWQYTIIGVILATAVLVPTFRSLLNGTFFARLDQLHAPAQSLGDRATTVWGHYIAHFEPGFLFNTSTDWITRHYVRGFGMLYGIEAPFLILGVAVMLARRKRSDILFLVWFLIYPVAAALVGPPVSTRSITGVIVFQIAVAQGVYLVVRGVALAFGRSSATRPYRGLAVAAVSVALLIGGLVTSAGFMRAYLNDYPRYASDWAGWQAGPQQIVAYFESHQTKYDRMYMSADFNAPDELLTFYTATNPNACSACGIDNIEDRLATRAAYQPAERELWAIPPAVFETSVLRSVPYRIVGRLTYPSGKTSFLFVATGPGVRGSPAG
jgi:4-amino-4-deoxy-L-arabinose transferase-like glycosyltransferase